jgi:hypothetical protein
MTETTPELIEAEVRQFVANLLRGGYDDVDEIVPNAMDYFAGTYDEELVGDLAERIVPAELEKLTNEQKFWPPVTDYDRLARAFKNLQTQGIVMRENFTCCQTCGMAEIGAEIEAEEGEGLNVSGFGFFHVQDTERVVESGQLYLSFGSVEDRQEASLDTARRIVSALQQEGLNVSWDGTAVKRIEVHLKWQRRVAAAG